MSGRDRHSRVPFKGVGIVAALAMLLALSRAEAGEVPSFTADEVKRILSHGPWPSPWTPDPSNRVSGNVAAAALGRQLFFDARLSRFGALSCAFCHQPTKAWGDGRVQASSAARLERNTTSLYNVRYFRWFGWDGASDSLWMHSIRPLLDPREMAASGEHVKKTLSSDRKLAAAYRKVFGTSVAADESETALVNTAKALAAFQETIVTGRTPFDRYRDALAKNDKSAMARYPADAERGLRIFVGKGQCSTCHAGPLFTNGAFHDIGLTAGTAAQSADTGREGGLAKLRSSPYNRLGTHSDDTLGGTGNATQQALDERSGARRAFKVPSLRNVALTAPYMHNGTKATLADVVRHYSELDEQRVQGIGETTLRRLDLNAREISDLVAFFESLTDPKDARISRKRHRDGR